MSSYDPFNRPPSGGGGGGGPRGPRGPSRDPMEELTRNFKNKGGSFFSMGLILLPPSVSISFAMSLLLRVYSQLAIFWYHTDFCG